MLDYRVRAHRTDSHGSEAMTRDARLALDTDMAGRNDAFNPVGLLPASLAACLPAGPFAGLRGAPRAPVFVQRAAGQPRSGALRDPIARSGAAERARDTAQAILPDARRGARRDLAS